MEQKRLLAVLAHPDDESFGLGGTLARYAAEGVDVHIAIATDGAVGSVAEGYESVRERLADVRRHELYRAILILRARLHMLGYRDSGYVGDPANEHPDAFIRADEEEAVGRVVALIREIRPQVVVTHDETGGYFHPDHIFCWQITTAAFHAAGNGDRYPEIGPAPYLPQRLYYSVFPKRWVRLFTWMMRLRGQDPKRAGRNKDIDFTQLGMAPEKIHAIINYRAYWEQKAQAGAAHSSQGGGGPGGFFPVWFQKRFLAREMYQRAYPPTPDGFRERNLFAGVQSTL